MAARADWPTLRGNPQRTGFVQAELPRPFRLAWALDIDQERLGTAMEPIVADGRLFVATHCGNLYAIQAESGEPLWRFAAHGPFLQSPAVAGELVVAASADGMLWGLEAATGMRVWQWFGGHAGFSASPTIAGPLVLIGTRGGDFVAVSLATGKLVWRQAWKVPIRQTAAVADGQVFVIAEDLHVRCLNAADGQPVWTSERLSGQTARDYYPIIVQRDGRQWVVVRTNPVLNMGQRIGRDRSAICRAMGVDDSGWQKLEAWIKQGETHGQAELWKREQDAIVAYLDKNPDARSFFAWDAKSGVAAGTPPVLWIAGCQGVGAEPAVTAEGRLLVFYRSVYGNWNHGVAPLVALGLLDLGQSRITPLFHQQGRQPQWNCFWGTADESQNFQVVGDTALIVHQGTLSGFDLKKNELFPIWGERDTFGGFRSPPWARNEWHGPGRGGVAFVGRRLYWQTGSRVLCLVAGEKPAGSEKLQPRTIAGSNLPTVPSSPPPVREVGQVREQLIQVVDETLSGSWAPLFTDPGLAGRVFSFDHSSQLFEALAWAYPHLPDRLQRRVQEALDGQWTRHSPFTRQGAYALQDGAPREWFDVPVDFRTRLGTDRAPHPFGGVYAAWLFGERCERRALVEASWPKIRTAFADFSKSGWRLDPAQGDPHANLYLAALLATGRLAEGVGDAATARQARDKADETTAALVTWWKRAAQAGTMRVFKGSQELDPFIGKGDGVSLAVAPHRHQLALFQNLTPEIAALLQAQAPAATAEVLRTFQVLYRTWWLQGEERQVHFGENFVDSPDLALSGCRALAWLGGASPAELARYSDIACCRADLFQLIKLSLALQQPKR